ncbi:hypothetical protein L596_018182 [Steinernema carpocapsae]|uniref:Uncharacterized protein n=1 Tax=Steinernema carpocapsae TaxID=34508 RepID=A0A4U5N4M0_STECR|nr:hypothetical protein L596_018182 [Steinernema carpocapsae]
MYLLSPESGSLPTAPGFFRFPPPSSFRPLLRPFSASNSSRQQQLAFRGGDKAAAAWARPNKMCFRFLHLKFEI